MKTTKTMTYTCISMDMKDAPAWVTEFVRYGENILGDGWTISQDGGRISGILWMTFTAIWS